MVVAAGLGGCAPSRQEQAPPTEEGRLIEPNSFMQAWQRDIPAQFGRMDRLFLRDDMVFAYTEQNAVYALSSAGGRTLWVTRDVVGPLDRIWPPLLLDALNRFGPEQERVVACPASTSYIIFDVEGERIQETSLEQGERAITSPSYGYEGLAYAGLADDHGGRAAKIDPTRLVNPILKPALLRGAIIGRPVVYDDMFFVSDQTGSVYAIDDAGDRAWSIPRFETGGPITATLTADEHGLYVPSTDSVLYVLDRLTGRMKWRFFAEVSLGKPAFPTEDHVFLPVENRGVVALLKSEGRTINREPVWTAEGAREILSHDEQNVYLLHSDGRIVAHRKTTGEAVFSTERRDFRIFARNLEGPRIFAATLGGEVVAIDPVLTRGRLGTVVKADTDKTAVASSR